VPSGSQLKEESPVRNTKNPLNQKGQTVGVQYRRKDETAVNSEVEELSSAGSAGQDQWLSRY